MVFVNISSTRIFIIGFQSRKYFRDGYSHTFQLVRLYGNFILLEITSQGIDFCNSRRSQKLLLDNQS